MSGCLTRGAAVVSICSTRRSPLGFDARNGWRAMTPAVEQPSMYSGSAGGDHESCIGGRDGERRRRSVGRVRRWHRRPCLRATVGGERELLDEVAGDGRVRGLRGGDGERPRDGAVTVFAALDVDALAADGDSVGGLERGPTDDGACECRIAGSRRLGRAQQDHDRGGDGNVGGDPHAAQRYRAGAHSPQETGRTTSSMRSLFDHLSTTVVVSALRVEHKPQPIRGGCRTQAALHEPRGAGPRGQRGQRR